MSNNKRPLYKLVLSVILIIAPLFLLTDFPKLINENDEQIKIDCLVLKTDEEKDKANNVSEVYKNLESDYLKLSYSNAVKEVQKRIEHEHLLFVLNFTLVGAVLSILFKNNILSSPRDKPENIIDKSEKLSPAIICWAAIAVSAIVDVRMLVNLDIIKDLGGWVHCLENNILTSGVKGWETYFANSPLLSSGWSPLLLMDRQLLTWVLYVFTIFSFVIYKNRAFENHLLPFLLCILLFGFVGLHFYFRVENGFWFYIPFFIVITTISCFAYSQLINIDSTQANKSKTG